MDRLLLPAIEEEAGFALDERHRRILDHLEARGASFHPEVVELLPEPLRSEAADALWDLVWAGLVTNDTFAALRALTTPRRFVRRDDAMRGASRARTGPVPAGRWSLVRDLVRSPVSSTERATTWAATLLDRHGLVARETAAVEALGGGFASVYGVLRSMEDAGKVRRGYFVEGLGGAQFAYPGVVDRLRRARDESADVSEVVALAATDPANPYGWLLPWPEVAGEDGSDGTRPLAVPRRAAGAVVVLVGGGPVLYLDRAGRRLRTFASAGEEELARALTALPQVARTRPRRALALARVDGDPATRSGLTPLLRAAGFREEYRFMRLTVG